MPSHYVIVQKQGTVLLLQDRKAWYACDTASGGCTLKSVPLKGKVLNTQYDAVGDPSRPLVSVAAGGLDPFYAVAPGPVLVKRFDPLVAKASVVGLSMGVNRLVGWDDRLGGAVWQRPLGDGIGAEKRLADRAEAALASAGRTAVATASGVAFYDRSTAVSRGSAVNALLGFSGPYALLDRGSGWFDLTGYAGVPMGSYVRAPGHLRAIFGTRVLGGTDCLQGSAMCTGSGDGETTLVVTDLLDATYRRPIPLPDGVDARTSHVQAAFLWGDRVAASFTSADPGTGEATVRSAVYDMVAGTWGDLQDARLLGLGDGYAVREDGDGLSAWDYVTGETYRLSDTDGGTTVTAGSDTLAYANDDEIVVRRVPGTGASAPRVLGVVAPAGCNAWDCAWSPQFDLTKALDAGQVVIRDPQGEVVRTLRTAATTDGSVRGVTWDGRSDTGAFVVAGDYRWQLVVAAADGSGTATGVDGTSCRAARSRSPDPPRHGGPQQGRRLRHDARRDLRN
ncbi:MAG: FlgD immunoglobulin-like domain containing protein [Propionicimonas sp.]